MRNSLLGLFLIFSLSATASVKIIAHRGASGLAPENTIASAKLGWELGADAVEIDVYLSSDNQVVVIHDETTKRTSLGETNYKVSETSSDVLTTIDVGRFKSEKYTGETIPLLDDILPLIPDDKALVIEVKCGKEIIPALKKAIDESEKINQCIFISFGLETICAIQKTFPNNECAYLKMTPLGLKKDMKIAHEAGVRGINLYHKIINPKIVSQARDMGMHVMAWTVDEPDAFEKLSEMGVVGITTNKPEVFVK